MTDWRESVKNSMRLKAFRNHRKTLEKTKDDEVRAMRLDVCDELIAEAEAQAEHREVPGA